MVNKALAREYSVNFLVGDCVLLAYTRRCFNNLFTKLDLKPFPIPDLLFSKTVYAENDQKGSVLLEIDFKVFNSKNNSNYKP